MGGLIGVAEPGEKDGLVAKSAAPKVVTINNNLVKITLTSKYQSANFAISVYDGGETGLIFLVSSPNTPHNAVAKSMSIIRSTKLYVKDNSIYIYTDATANASYSIVPLSVSSQIQAIESIPRQTFDDGYTEVPITSL